MKKYFSIVVAAFLISCDKNETNHNEYVDITYELQTNATGFLQLKSGNFYSLSNGVEGVILEDWDVQGTGNFTKTISIRKGFKAEALGIHASSADWSLKIKAANGNVLNSGVPAFNADSNFYYLKITASAQ